MKIKLNFLILILFSSVAFFLNFLSDGNLKEIGSDFYFYYNRLIYIRDYDVPISQWFSNSIENYSNINLFRVSNFVPSPFYSLIFLGPLLLHNSNFLFALQGVLVAFLTFRIIRKHLDIIYYSINKKFLNLMVILGSLNPAFLKDSLTSGPISICNLFLLYAFFYNEKTVLASFLLACAAMTRSTYIIYWVVIFLTCFVVSRKWIKKFIKISLPSLLVYAIFYLFFYKTYPGSEISHMYLPGLKAMTNYEEFFVNALSKYFPVSNKAEIQALDINFVQLLSLILTDLKIAYGTFISWIFKILASLGFLHSTLFWDSRSIYLQRLVVLIYFIFIMAPSFLISSISLLSISKQTEKFWFKKEFGILFFAVSFLLIHSLIMGLPRYMTSVSWIFSAFLVRFLIWFRKVQNKRINYSN